MTPRMILLFILFLALRTASGQVEANPYVGLVTGDRGLEVTLPADGVDSYTGGRLLLGADFLLGAGSLAPMGGLIYHFNTYAAEAGSADFRYHRLHLPLGVAYRLLPADLDLNLVAKAAVAPGLVLGDATVSGTEVEGGLSWAARAGATLYIYGLTVGVDYYVDLANRSPAGANWNWAALTLGFRF